MFLLSLKIKQKLREIRNRIQRCFLKQKDFTIISNNCLAGCVLHDLGERFNTPTINLYIPFPDYIVFLQNLQTLVYADFEEIPNDSGCPKGLLGGSVNVFFLHYSSYEEGVKVWKKRAERIHWDNLFVVLSERDGCTYQDLCHFDALQYAHKVALTHIHYPDIKSHFCIKGYSKQHEIGNIMGFKGWWGKKIYDQFNWINFLNKKTCI